MRTAQARSSLTNLRPPCLFSTEQERILRIFLYEEHVPLAIIRILARLGVKYTDRREHVFPNFGY